jgi:hypothetical protein
MTNSGNQAWVLQSRLYIYSKAENKLAMQVNASCRGHALSSPPTEGMGRFGLTAQAAVLLGRVFRNMHDNTGGDDFRNDEARVLDNTISALTKVSLEEGRYRGIGVCSPTTICYR